MAIPEAVRRVIQAGTLGRAGEDYASDFTPGLEATIADPSHLATERRLPELRELLLCTSAAPDRIGEAGP